MPIPDFQSLMLPLLRIAGDHQEHSLTEATDILSDQYGLSESERHEMLPGSRQTRINNSVGWASAYLRRAGLLERTGRGRFCITEHGAAVLEGSPPRITIGFLKQFNEFLDFSDETDDGGEGFAGIGGTPEETIQASYYELNGRMHQDVQEMIKACENPIFEKAMIDLLFTMDYGGSRQAIREAFTWINDYRLDAVIKEDKLGLELVYVQIRRDDNIIQHPDVQSFSGSLEGFGASKGVMITTSTFSDQAREYVQRIQRKIVLIDGEYLARLLMDNGIGVVEMFTYIVQKIDRGYWTFFEEG